MIKFQKIAQEQSKCLRQTRVELDQEKAESEYLRQEVNRLKKVNLITAKSVAQHCLECSWEKLTSLLSKHP